jgi:hypothetical protein
MPVQPAREGIVENIDPSLLSQTDVLICEDITAEQAGYNCLDKDFVIIGDSSGNWRDRIIIQYLDSLLITD